MKIYRTNVYINFHFLIYLNVGWLILGVIENKRVTKGNKTDNNVGFYIVCLVNWIFWERYCMCYLDMQDVQRRNVRGSVSCRKELLFLGRDSLVPTDI